MQERVERALREAGVVGRPLLVAVSGGLDSTALLHALVRLREPLALTLTVGHVDHGLRGEGSAADARFVADLAAGLGLPFACERVAPHRQRAGRSSRARPTLQEAARSLRRDALEAMRDRLGCSGVVTGHHADDQAETVLMRLLRGASPDALGGIAEHSRDGRVLRPLLAVSRAEIEAFAVSARLAWREDASNADPRYTRNRLRADWIPRLAKDFNPRLLRALCDLAEAQRRDSEWLDALTREAADSLVQRQAAGGMRIAGTGWGERPEALERRLVKQLLVEAGGGRDLSRVQLLRVLRFLRQARPGTRLELPGGIRLSRDRDTFFLHPATPL